MPRAPPLIQGACTGPGVVTAHCMSEVPMSLSYQETTKRRFNGYLHLFRACAKSLESAHQYFDGFYLTSVKID